MSRHLLDRPEITSHDVVTRAMHRTSTDEFGGSAWMEPLEVLTRSLDREAKLTMSARRGVRHDLVGRLVERHADDSRTAAASHRPIVIVTGPDPESVQLAESALGAPQDRGTNLLESAFTSMSYELRWQVPSYAEWLAEADLDAAYADVARRSAASVGAAPLDVLGAIEFAERIETIDRAFPGAFLVEVDRPFDDAVATVAAVCAQRRNHDSRAVEPAKIERYWHWRLGVRAERREAGRPADLTVSYDELVAAPAALASTVAASTGGASPPR